MLNPLNDSIKDRAFFGRLFKPPFGFRPGLFCRLSEVGDGLFSLLGRLADSPCGLSDILQLLLGLGAAFDFDFYIDIFGHCFSSKGPDAPDETRPAPSKKGT
jgi:hypothetical protein